jgi:tetratricopeptide (TPR) repeat protein
MAKGALPDARSSFDQVIAIAPDFAEGWNKRATVAYMQGDFDSSVHDIQKTLALEPRHFGALSGLALIYENLGKEETALDILLQVKEIYPGMPGLDQRMLDLRDLIKAKRT